MSQNRVATALAIAWLLASAAPTAQTCAGGQTLTAADLEAQGWGRLHDALRPLDALDVPSVDGFDAMPVVRPVGAGRLRWLVDGLPVAGPAGIDPDGMELLPVALLEVARVTVCPGPGLAAGAWGGPWVEIETRRPAPLAAAAVDYGNETGDPGPARFLAGAGPNVERWGPDIEAALAPASGVWATLRGRRFYPTDTAMVARIVDAVAPGRFPVRAVAVAGLHAEAGGWTLRGGGVRGADLPHVPALGREVPVARRHLQASAGGPLATLGPVRLAARVHAARLSLNRPSWGALALDPAWTEWRALAGVDGALARSGGTLRAGVQGEVTHADAPGLTAPTVGVARVWGQAAAASDSGHARVATVAATVAGRDATLGVGIEQRWPLAGGHVALSLATHRRAGADQPTLADWTARGYTGLGGTATLDPSTPFAPPGETLRQSESVARISGALPFADAFTAAWSAEVQQSEGPVEHPLFVLAPGAVAVSGGTETRRAQGVAAVVRASVGWRRSAVAVRAFGRVQGPLSSRGAFAEAWARQPAWRGGAEVTVRPDARLALWARLDASAATRWDGTPSPRVPGAVLLDLGLSQRAFGDRLRLSLSGRNTLAGLLGATERTHPLGVDLAPRLFVRVEVRV